MVKRKTASKERLPETFGFKVSLCKFRITENS